MAPPAQSGKLFRAHVDYVYYYHHHQTFSSPASPLGDSDFGGRFVRPLICLPGNFWALNVLLTCAGAREIAITARSLIDRIWDQRLCHGQGLFGMPKPESLLVFPPSLVGYMRSPPQHIRGMRRTETDGEVVIAAMRELSSMSPGSHSGPDICVCV